MINSLLNSLALTGGVITSEENSDLFQNNSTMCFSCHFNYEPESESSENKENSSSDVSAGIVLLPDIILSHVTESAIRIREERERNIRSPRRSRRRERSSKTSKSSNLCDKDRVEVLVDEESSVNSIDIIDGRCDYLCNQRQFDYNETTYSAANFCSYCNDLRIKRLICRTHKWQMRDAGIILKVIGDKFQENYPKSFENSQLKNFLNESSSICKVFVTCCLVGFLVSKMKKSQWL